MKAGPGSGGRGQGQGQRCQPTHPSLGEDQDRRGALAAEGWHRVSEVSEAVLLVLPPFSLELVVVCAFLPVGRWGRPGEAEG